MHSYFPLAITLLGTLGVASTAAAQPKLDAAVELANGKAYFFRGNQAALYDLSREHVDPGQPVPLCTAFPGLPDIWCRTGIDSAMLGHGGGKVHFFKGREYLTFNLQRRVVELQPRPIAAGWTGVWPDGINVAVNAGNGKAYFFKGNQYVKFDFRSNKVEGGYPKPNAGNWPRWPAAWFNGIDAAFCRLNGKVFFFKGRDYIRYDIPGDKGDEGYPMVITEATWGGLPAFLNSGSPVAASPPAAPSGVQIVDVPGIGPVALPAPPGPLVCPREYVAQSDGDCAPTPPVRTCLQQVADSARARKLYDKRPCELTMDEARDLTIALYEEKHIKPHKDFQPVFDAQCKVTGPWALQDPKASKVRGYSRYGIAPTIDGVSFHYLQFADGGGRQRYGRPWAPAPITELELRMVPALVKLVAYLKGKYGVTRIIHAGITTGRGVHIQTGFTIDFIGACGGQLGPCYGEPGVCTTFQKDRPPGSCREPGGFYVLDDWGKMPVPPEKAAKIPHDWREDVKDPIYRLSLPGADARARDFFKELYEFFELQYRSGPISPIGQHTGNITPDHPKSEPGGATGREAHKNHIHAELTGR